jgi:hypothetical protein
MVMGKTGILHTFPKRYPSVFQAKTLANRAFTRVFQEKYRGYH